MSGGIGGAGGTRSPGRGQLVIAMAVVVTVALVPVAAAYLQLGYIGGQEPSRDDTTTSTVNALDQAISGVESELAGQYAWAERDTTTQRTRTLLEPRIQGIESSSGSETRAIEVSYNQTLADRVAATDCPGSWPGRAFGPCDAQQGIVLQERAGEVVLVAVAVDLRVVSTDGTTTASVVLEP